MKKLLLALTLVLCLAVSLLAFTSCGGDGTGEDDGACEHTWATEATVDTAATCTEEGVATIKCTACGEKKADSETVVPATGHTYGAETTVDPTCTADGSVTKTCTACGDVNVTTTPATGHTWATEATVDTAATCTTDGAKSIKCTACNEVKPESTETIPATGHTWATEATVDVEPTCIADGSKSIKCTVCNEKNPETIEAVPSAGQHTWANETVVTTPTLFTEGLKTGTCSVCNEALSDVLPKAPANLNAIDDTINNSKAPNGTMSIGDALGDKTFAPGVDLYLEYSVLLNETMSNISGKGIGWGHIAKNADVTVEGSTVVKSFSWLYHTADAKWCPFVGGFEFSEAKSFVYGPVWQANNNNADDFVIIEYGWHRIGLQYTQNVYENNGEFTYDVTATVYVDGVKVSEQIMDWGDMFYSAEIVDGETVYTQNENISDYYVVVYRIGNPELDDGATEAYFPYGDVYLTAGNGFVMDVAPVENPEAQDFTQGEVTLPGKVYYAPVCYHDNADMTTTIAPTLFSEGAAKGTCPDCGEKLSVVLPMTEAYVITVTATTKDDHLVKEGERLGDVLADGQHFYPTEDNPNGNSLYVEFSILLNSTMDNFVGTNISFPGIHTDRHLSSQRGHSAFWFYIKNADGIAKGKCDDWTSNAVDKNNPDMYYNNQTALAFDGWHRIAVEFHQNDNIDYDNFEVTSTMTVTMYYDGVKVYEATLGNGTKPAEQELLLYTATFEGDEVVYTDCVDSYAAYMSYNAYVTDAANPAYLPFADQYVTAGNDGFVLNVVPVADPAAATYEVAEGVEVSGKQYFKVERTPLQNLRDDTLTEYEYPMDKVVGENGAIIYWGTGENKNAYLLEADGEAVGFYKNAFIEITDTTFNYVTIVANGTKTAGWAFLTEMPEVGEKASYAGYFADINKFGWTVDKTGYAKIEIPEGAKYLVVYYEEEGNSYLPASITFTKEDKPVAEGSYSYPMDTIVPFEGYINHGDDAIQNKNKYHYLRHKANNESHAFIDISGLDYNTVTITAPANGESTNYAFLSVIPTENDEKICYATGYSDMVWFGVGNGELTLTIPEDAVCLVVLHHYSDGTVTMPESIVFSNRDTTPAEMLKNDTLDSYEYPMTEIKPSMGTIRGTDNVFIRNFRWVGSLVSIEGCVFDKVVFEIDETYGKISYGFLTDYPTVGEVVSFAGETGMTTANIADGATVTVDIPDDAKVLVIYWQDWNETNNTPIYYIPESVTFIKAEDAGDITPPAGGDSEDSEDAGTTTPGGSTDSEDAETTTPANPGFGTATDSEDSENAGTTTPTNPGFGSASDSEDAG